MGIGENMGSRYDDFQNYGENDFGRDGYDDAYDADFRGGYDHYDVEYGNGVYEDDRYAYADDGYAYEEAPYEEEVSQPAARRTGKGKKNRKTGSSARKASAGTRKKTGTGKRPASAGRRQGKKGRKRKKKSASPVFAILLMILVLGMAFGAKLFLDRYSYSTEQADLSEQFNVQGADDVPIVWGNELSEIHAKRIDGIDYMKLDDVKSQLNSRFYYGKQNAQDETGMILYCFPTDKLKTVVGSTEVSTEQGGSQTLDYAPAVNVDGTIYLALNFVKQYTNFGMTAYENPSRLQIDTAWGEETVATISRKTQIRTSGGIKSPVLEQLEKGAKVTVLEQMDTWSKVKSEDSVIGYVENRRLSDIQTQTMTAVADYTEPEVTHLTFDGKINMAFHNVWGSQGNVTLTSYMAQTKTVNIVAPTWYWVSDNDGNVEKAATQEYVNQAHSMGCQVWAVVDNINSSSLQQLDNHTFLTTLDARTNLISQLTDEAKTYGFDGINVDFELIPEENGEDYIEFIRELSIACRNAGIILSVDTYPNFSFNSHYHLDEQGVFADYIVIMGYDEHYAGSQEAGSVASISYVTQGIQMALNDGIAKDRLINAIPFYSRVWETDGGQVSSKALGMQDIQDYIQAHGMSVNWSAEAGQNYAETTEDGRKIQIWVEDAQSIQQKLDVMQSFGIKGVAEWRLQFETADVWDTISNYMNQ